MPVPVTRALTEANGNLAVAMRSLRCFCCDARLVDVAGDAFRIEARCSRCKTLVIVVRPMTGELARRFGIRAQAAAPVGAGA
jgi:phage FluMu protein Com